jgi:molybdate transport repressor ModE-like protein
MLPGADEALRQSPPSAISRLASRRAGSADFRESTPGALNTPVLLDEAQLRVLRAVAVGGSISAAAKALSSSPTAVSRQVSALESATGTRLLERRPSGVRLTEAGRLLVRHAGAIHDRLAVAEAELGDLREARRGSLRFAAFPSALVSLVAGSVKQFRRRHPAVELTLSRVDSEDAGPRVRAGELDLAVICHDEPGSSTDAGDGLVRTHLLDVPLYLLMSRKHPLSRELEIRLEDLSGEEWVQGTESPCTRAFYAACRQAGFQPRVTFEIDDLLAIQSLVAAGAACTLLPGLALGQLPDEVVVRAFGSATPRRPVAAISRDTSYSPSAHAMLALLQRNARRLERQLQRLPDLPSGHRTTTERVLGTLAAANGPLSAVEVGKRIGISRATAHRYLASLVASGSVRLELRQGATGRPEHRYELGTLQGGTSEMP